MKVLQSIVFILLPLLMLNQCAGSRQSTQSHVATAPAQWQSGTVTSSQPIQRSGVSGVGHLLGAIGGAILGSKIGSGHTAFHMGSMGGALLGGAGGDLAEAKLRKNRHHEIIIQTEGHLYKTITNGQPPLFRGDHVRFLTNTRGGVQNLTPAW